ncbi:putative NADP-dependent oxidoreductase domain-containing protein [Seiridium unicorne]|uniref:NADP-dependent oxidoreductase domain-containing protein n=1 Tax=Seiridium unicorne TaxID=138068 RepID=A0ABR2UJJ7_9PEZI
MAIPEFRLPSGAKLAQLAYGTGTVWCKENEDEVDRPTVDIIKTAIALGYRHLDGAQYYKNETELGIAIKESGVPRSEFFITTKVFGHKDIEGHLRASLQKIGTDYIDLYLIHEPFSAGGSEEALQKAWRDIEACHEKGLARDIGVSNFLVADVQAVLKTAKTKPAVNQIELHAYLQRTKLVEFCQSNGIVVEAYAPLTPLTKASPGPVDDVVNKLAKKYGVSASALLLRWLIEKDIVAITTSGKEERLKGYLSEVPSLKLSQQEVDDISKAGEGKKFRQYMAELYEKDSYE